MVCFSILDNDALHLLNLFGSRNKTLHLLLPRPLRHSPFQNSIIVPTAVDITIYRSQRIAIFLRFHEIGYIKSCNEEYEEIYTGGRAWALPIRP